MSCRRCLGVNSNLAVVVFEVAFTGMSFSPGKERRSLLPRIDSRSEQRARNLYRFSNRDRASSGPTVGNRPAAAPSNTLAGAPRASHGQQETIDTIDAHPGINDKLTLWPQFHA